MNGEINGVGENRPVALPPRSEPQEPPKLSNEHPRWGLPVGNALAVLKDPQLHVRYGRPGVFSRLSLASHGSNATRASRLAQDVRQRAGTSASNQKRWGKKVLREMQGAFSYASTEAGAQIVSIFSQLSQVSPTEARALTDTMLAQWPLSPATATFYAAWLRNSAAHPVSHALSGALYQQACAARCDPDARESVMEALRDHPTMCPPAHLGHLTKQALVHAAPLPEAERAGILHRLLAELPRFERTDWPDGGTALMAATLQLSDPKQRLRVLNAVTGTPRLQQCGAQAFEAACRVPLALAVGDQAAIALAERTDLCDAAQLSSLIARAAKCLPMRPASEHLGTLHRLSEALERVDGAQFAESGGVLQETARALLSDAQYAGFLTHLAGIAHARLPQPGAQRQAMMAFRERLGQEQRLLAPAPQGLPAHAPVRARAPQGAMARARAQLAAGLTRLAGAVHRGLRACLPWRQPR